MLLLEVSQQMTIVRINRRCISFRNDRYCQNQSKAKLEKE